MKEYNLLLVRCERWDGGTNIWEMTGLGWIVFCLVVIATISGLILGICVALEKASCNDVAEVTGLDTTYRNIAGCFVEVSDGVWVSTNTYFVGRVQQIE